MSMLGRWTLVGALALGGFGGTALARGGGEAHGTHQDVTLQELPAPVRSTFQKEAQGGRLEELERKSENGKTVYEGEVVKNGKGTELEVGADGSVLQREPSHDEAAEHESH